MDENFAGEHRPEAHEATSDSRGGSLWQTLRAMFTPPADAQPNKLQRHLYELNALIDRHPDAPANYVLRGELYLKAGRVHEAILDFERALEIASADLETRDWAVVAQVIENRARVGLQRATRRARHRSEQNEAEE